MASYRKVPPLPLPPADQYELLGLSSTDVWVLYYSLLEYKARNLGARTEQQSVHGLLDLLDRLTNEL